MARGYNLQLEAVRMLDDGAHHCVFDHPVLQFDADFVARLKLIWLLWLAGHGGRFYISKS